MSTKEMVKTAEKLELDAKKLREAADIMQHNIRFEPSTFDGTRAEQLAAFIEKHGGKATRTEIVEESGIPPGTVASLLGTGKKFEKDKSGFWHSKPHRQEVPSATESAQKQA